MIYSSLEWHEIKLADLSLTGMLNSQGIGLGGNSLGFTAVFAFFVFCLHLRFLTIYIALGLGYKGKCFASLRQCSHHSRPLRGGYDFTHFIDKETDMQKMHMPFQRIWPTQQNWELILGSSEVCGQQKFCPSVSFWHLRGPRTTWRVLKLYFTLGK